MSKKAESNLGSGVQISGGLTGPADINTDLNFVNKANVDPFLHAQSRSEGNSSEEKVLTHSGPVA